MVITTEQHTVLPVIETEQSMKVQHTRLLHSQSLGKNGD